MQVFCYPLLFVYACIPVVVFKSCYLFTWHNEQRRRNNMKVRLVYVWNTLGVKYRTCPLNMYHIRFFIQG